jgi:DNA-binding transcriptional LysR family regulator
MANLGEGQETITVASMDAKLRFLLAGPGVGYLSVCVARPYGNKGLLKAKELDTLPALKTSISRGMPRRR